MALLEYVMYNDTRKGGDELDKNLFISRIKSMRKNRKKTQQEIADILNVQRSTYGEYERGNITPPMDKISKLADYYNVSTDFLLGGPYVIKVEKENNTQLELFRVDVINLIDGVKEQLANNTIEIEFKGKPLNEAQRSIIINNLDNLLQNTEIIMNSMNNHEQQKPR